MNRKAIKTFAATLATGLGLLGGALPSVAQTPPPPPPAAATGFPGDWPNLGAYNNRQGQNAAPLTFTSGLTNLRYFAPSTRAELDALILDNTDVSTNFVSNGGNFDDPVNNAGRVSAIFSADPTDGWHAPADVTKEASSPYTVAIRATTAPINTGPRTPSYVYARTTPSAKGAAAYVPADATKLRYFEWTFTPAAGISRGYGVYTYVPSGQTDTTATGVTTPNRLFPERYFVYRIFFGPDANNDGIPDRSYTDIVDTELAGTSNFIRVGAAGAPTQVTFPSDGSRIVVRLYNTVPRDSNGVLELTGATGSLNAAQEQTLANNHLVYADAVQALPQSGSSVASPTASTVTANGNLTALDATADWRLTIARNLNGTDFVGDIATPTVDGTVINYEANPALWPLTAQTTPQEKWRYSVVGSSAASTTVDNASSTATHTPNWTVNNGATLPPANPKHIGADYLTVGALVRPSPDTNPATQPTATATYAPSLANGDYAIYAYIPGSFGTQNYARAVEYQIYEGGTTPTDTVVIDQSQSSGWVRLGSRRYANVRDTDDNVNPAPISVVVTNITDNPGDTARLVYADAIRFVGSASISVTSTPIHATVKITNAPAAKKDASGNTKVVVVADEAGKIHCLDLAGNGDGTTTEYWSYPSTPDPTVGDSYADPNLTEGLDGVIDPAIAKPIDNQPTAEMPIGFDLSSGAVAHVGTKDLLYIASTNGRVYCIDMSGRGDFDENANKVGTTRRVWSYPSDFPSTVDTATLGSFRGSIVVGETAQTGASAPLVYVPSTQGRIYALDAAGTPAAGGNAASGVTTVAWQFPVADHATLPSIQMTPTLFKPAGGNGRLLFGTVRDTNADGSGQFYCLDATSGDILWQYNGASSQDTTDPHDLATTIRHTDADVRTVSGDTTTLGNFTCGVVAVAGTTLDAVPKGDHVVGTAPTSVDTVYALNGNLNLYGLKVSDGSLVTYTDAAGLHGYNQPLSVVRPGVSDQSLSYTVITTNSRLGTLKPFPVITSPTTDGSVFLSFARPEDYSANFDYFATYRDVKGNAQYATAPRSVAAANNFLFALDVLGRLFAYDNLGSAGGNLPPGVDLGLRDGSNLSDPSGRPFRHLHIKLVNPQGYAALRAVDPVDGTGGLTYDQAVNSTTYNKTGTGNGTLGNPYAFEWGETAYVLVYGFPYALVNERPSGSGGPQAVAPPQVTVSFSIEGRIARQIPIDSRQFHNPTSAPAVEEDPNGVGYKQDGYAIVPFPFRPSGSSSLPPGNGTITATVASAATSTTTTVTEFIPDIRTSTDSIIHFVMANPLAVVIADPVTGGATGPGIGYTIDPSDVDNLVNGTPNTTRNALESQLQASAGTGNHGGSTTARVYVYDRSLTALLQEDGIGNVRVQRTNLRRQGGTVGIFRRLSPTLYPTFEDAPVNFPNTSLDYPDIGREQVRAIKDPNGNAENPVATNVSLKVPVADSGAALTPDNYSLGAGRRLVPTRLDLTVDIPRYQPPVNTGGMTSAGVSDNPNDLLHLRHNSAGAILDQGYFGRVQVFVDSTGDSRLNTDVREAYRAFNLSAGVSPQLSILVGSPNVDLGSLAAGTGYSTLNPANGGINGIFNPWSGAWSSVYKPMIVRNDGNVNLIDLRLAKATNDPNVGPGNRPWALTSVDNDPLAWMSAVNIDPSGNPAPGDLWSNIDTTFSLTNTFAPAGSLERRAVILPKPRVTDRVPTELLANPYPRANPNTGATGKSNAVLDPTKPVSAPKLGVSVPIGFPVGNYATQVRVIENFPLDAPPVDNEILQFIPASNSYEAFSDPITLTYKVRETRMTNRTTPFTAPMIDDPSTFPNGGTGLGNDLYNGKAAFRNAAPAAMRNPAGALYVAWESDRNAAIPSGANAGNASVLYFASLNNGASFSASGTGAPANNSPLWDLGQFAPASNAQWFQPAPVGAYPSPAQATALFGEGTPVNGTTSFGSPGFPTQGSVNAIGNSTFGSSYMAFTGNAQVSTATGRISESKVFVTTVSTSGGNLTVGAPVELPSDPQTAKGKPSVLQTPTGAIVFYSETSAGQSSLAFDRIRASDGSRVGPFRLGFGDGFSSVFSPSAVVRRYRGFDAVQKNHFYVELSFAGKLRGRANAEAYIGRIPLERVAATDNNYQLVQIVNGVRSALEGADARSFALLPPQSNERLVSEGNGQYRARGVQWSRNQPIMLIQTLDGVSTNLLVGTGTVERQSGLIAYDSRLGGKVYLDPELGIVRFAGAFPNRNADIRLTYSPSFLRVTPGGSASYSAINGLFDERAVSVTDYWFSGTGTFTNSTGNVSTGVRNDRFLYAYGRGAAGGITARPYSTTMRFGVRLPTRVATDGQGRVLSVRVQGATKPYQVDPANGRVYFQAEDEDNPNIVVTYTGVSEATNGAVPGIQVAAAPSFVLERNEALLPVDEAANDSAVTAFLDPFNFGVGTRPPLVWLFYVSTRGGQPDLYFQTIAPPFTPFAK